MKVFGTHVVLMFLYAVATAFFFTLLWKYGRQERIRFFLFVFLSLFFGGIALGWIMMPFPAK